MLAPRLVNIKLFYLSRSTSPIKCATILYMPLDDRNKLNRLEELKSRLFSKNYQTRIEHRDSFSHLDRKDVLDSWKTREKVGPNAANKFFMKTSMFKKFFIFSIAFFVLTLGYAAYIFFVGGNTVSNNNIDISILGNNFTAGGEELPLIVGITNRNNSSLDLADLVVEYPKGSSGDLSSDIERSRISLGTIPAGAVRNENLKVVLFGEQGSLRPVKISLEYRVSGSNAIFIKEKLYEVNISSTPISLLVDAPLVVSPNQNITLNVKAILNATKPAPKILIKLNYPVGFQFVQSVPAPSFGNNIWNLGDLAPGAEHGISISGKMVDVFDGEEKTFNISSGSQSITDKSLIGVVFNSIGYTIAIKKPFIEANLFINGISQREYATDTKTPINVQIRYTNNLDTQVNDLVIQAKISGNAFDRKTIIAQQGFYNSSKDVITWDKNSQNQFKEVNPGDSGSVAFSVSPLSLFSAAGEILLNPSINIEVNISGKQALEGFTVGELNNSTSAVVRIISDVGFSAKALYYSGPFANTGPIPPKAEKTTTYTIIWTLSNTANSISKAQINSTLPPWIVFSGFFLPAAENLSYNPSTREIIWNADRILKGAGITGAKKEIAFQVSFTPSLSQVGTIPVIINAAILTGHDDFANVDVRVNKIGLNTKLDSDIAFPVNGSVVVE
ncbi:MAG: hypothetical protein UU82_C0002G0023 [Candidatus Nomurabacteria bacterium GW2011_GWC2_41_8]|uniref:DUF11 domain-containing protein n=2 Tax=Candidatus Nomuraibacteriota TaxID=1752729 RepID=A0A0G1AHB4_9BACT|nr:MAG: hypothetical protein UU58_C0002G0027 [Candidatus Nomurabacteria bacterium GW2011_GWA2_41_25]KKS24658.1 MAG: hypothetical protein UU82_C0002G0023 [Candidatus Nomurabacteria bacterium GW2011_GWC2_41_8]